MALGVALAGGVIMMIAVTLFGMAIPSFVAANEKASRVARAQAEIEDSILKTNIDITSISTNTTDNTVTVTMRNEGLTKLFNYDSFTVISSYHTPENNGSEVTEQFSYSGISEDLPQGGEWTIYSFDNDLRDPRILNSGESLEIKCRLSSELDSGTLTVTISTDNGVTASESIGV